ncbi:MAG: hypothetical protein E7012_06235 [Alphaproteobacteria bacterium]|nr:hypothetical protein [Alphaproteobacteria bacterium]
MAFTLSLLEKIMSDISLTASMRSNLLSLQNTQSLVDMTQERLSSGKKVNSALDNPSSYYASTSLTNRASDLNSLLDSMGQGIQTIKAADEGIAAITTFVEQAKALINTARDTAASDVNKIEVNASDFKAGAETDVELSFSIDGAAATTVKVDEADTIEAFAANLKTTLGDPFKVDVSDDKKGLIIYSTDKEVSWSLAGKANGVDLTSAGLATVPNARTSSQDQYNEILRQIDQLAKDSGYKGTNLLQSENLKVNFNEDRSSNLLVKGVEADSEGLMLVTGEGWDNADNKALETALNAVDAAINTLRTWSSELGTNFSILQNRENFTEELVNVLTEGSDKLVLADMNEESANMLALQTRQQLAINSLSLASQAAQGILKLF